MPKMKGQFDQYEYEKDYQKRYRITKVITFNRKNEDDMRMVAWLENRSEGIIPYIKALIRKDMEGNDEIR